MWVRWSAASYVAWALIALSHAAPRQDTLPVVSQVVDSDQIIFASLIWAHESIGPQDACIGHGSKSRTDVN